VDSEAPTSQSSYNHKVEKMVIMARAACLFNLIKLNAARLSENHTKVIDDFLKLVEALYLDKFSDPKPIIDEVHDIWNRNDMFSTISSPFFNPETPIDLKVFKNQREFLN